MGQPRRGSRRATLGPLFSRLRRVEVVVLHLLGVITLTSEEVDAFASLMLELRRAGESAGNREAVQVPHEGATDGEAEGDSGVDEWIRSKRRRLEPPQGEGS